MNNKKKKIIIISIILGILVLTIGLTYAMFTISKYSSNSKLIAGDIYMHYKEASQGIKLENAIPSDTYDTTSYFEFTIDGKNTYLKKDIYYEIVLAYGNEIQNKTRIKDNLLKFRLTEVIDNKETELFTDRSFSNLTNKRIWVETIPKGTNNEILKRYRLYMWLSNDTIICGGDETENCDYYIDKEPYWENVYASIKVGVNGDFEEKTLATDASCFTTEYDYEGATVNSIMASQTYQEPPTDNRNELSKCVDYFNKFEPNEGETALDFCKGTGTFFGNTFQTHLDNNSFDNTMLTELKELNIVINDNKVNSIMASQEYTELPDNRNELSKCMDYCKTDTFDDGSTNETYCKGTGTLNNKTFQDGLNNKSITLSNYLIDNNIVKVTGQTITITNYDDTCEKDVVIPSSINGAKVVAIGGSAFGGKQLTSVIIPNTVINIMDREYRTNAFGNNNLKKVIIPDSVTTIGDSAFYNNQLTNVSISNNIVTIGKDAFKDNLITNVKLSSSLTSIGKYAFENNQLETFEIPNGLTELTDFLGNNPLKSITFQENSKITEIGTGFVSDNRDMWKKYQNLESIEIPNSVTDITIVSGSFGPFYGLNLEEIKFENNSKLTRIPNNAFEGLKLVSINIPNSVKEIGISAFQNNLLTNVVIPNSVTSIDNSAFRNNQLTSVTIGNGIQYIGENVFYKGEDSNSNLSKITINKSCTDIKNIPAPRETTTKYYPWLSYSSPYTATGVTIYGSNNEVCDSY